jgi:hypothetical protein
LLHALFADVAVTAEHLQAEVGALESEIGKEGLNRWRQQRHQVFGGGSLGGVGVALLLIERARNPAAERPAALDVGALGQQHSTDVRMDNDRIGRLVRMLGAGQRAALQALAGMGDSALIGRLGEAEALDADGEALGVHHGEHGAHALVRFADEPACRIVEVDDAGRRCLDAHLVLDRAAGDTVAGAERAVVTAQELRD